MYTSALLMLLLLVCLIVSERKDYKGLCSFDKTTTLPLRGLLALLVVSHHLGQRTDIYPLSAFTTGIGFQTVAAFFFISGYGLCVSYLVKGRSYLDGFLQKRMGKLLPKFIVLTIGMVLGYYFFSSMDLSMQVAKITCGWTPLPHSWFIYAILYVYLVFYLCALAFESPKYVGILFTVAIILYIALFSKVFHFSSYWYVTIISVNLGYFVALYEERLEKLFNHKFAFYSALAALLFIAYCTMVKNRIGGLVTFASTEVWILVQAISVYAIVRTLGFLRWKWLCKMGVFSLELYLVHGIPLEIGLHLGLEDWSLWFFTYALSIPSAVLLNTVFDLIFPRKKLTLV